MAEGTSRRSRRPSSRAGYSAGFLAGYVEDYESVDAIMKKFEKMEQIMKESGLDPATGKANGAEGGTDGDAAQDPEAIQRHERMLERLARETAAVSIEDVLSGRDPTALYYVDDETLLDLGLFDEEDDDEYNSDERTGRGAALSSDSQEEGEGTAARSLARKRRAEHQGEASGTRVRFLEFMGRDGLVLRKRVTLVDPRIPVHVRLPPAPIPLSWARPIAPYSAAQPAEPVSMRLSALPDDFQAVYADPPWETGFDPKRLLALKAVQKSGLLFVWVTSAVLPAVLEALDREYVYVENVTWVRWTAAHRPCLVPEPGACIRCAKNTLLVCRRVSPQPLELMHQRNPDVVFDFVRLEDGREVKPSDVLTLIETILPNAKRLYLWPHRSLRRDNWTLVHKPEF